MNSINSLSRPNTNLAVAFDRPSSPVPSSQHSGAPRDGMDVNFGRDALDQILFSKAGGGRISCPEGTKPEITTEGNDVIVVCKPVKKKDPPTTLPINPGDTPILQ
jgi:hypothetical protein